VCLITFAYKVHPRFPLIVAANRDEFRDRPAAPAAWWSDGSGILAGRDLRAGGTWLGMTQQGRFAALTNHRDLSRPLLGGPSRGALVRNALMGSFSTDGTAAFDGFNLLYGTVGALRYHNNIDASDTLLNPGLHGLSNALLNTPWPKVERAKAALEKALHLPDEDLVSALFALLRDDEPAPVEDLPTTGLRLDMERAVSSIFIDTPGYGTRCSTVLLVNGLGRAHFEERSWPSGTSVVFDPTIDLRTEPTV
jgi:uncharacterized protein with NRDE domain